MSALLISASVSPAFVSFQFISSISAFLWEDITAILISSVTVAQRHSSAHTVKWSFQTLLTGRLQDYP